tara:strand:+ start:668 stop:1027 length:360 start_codon:yes stop_codon:yes gene_type:complete
MEPSTMHEIWLNLATNSPFLAFVMYNWYQQTKQNEAYRQEMKADREAYEQKREQAIEDIRLRYSKVIDDLKAERADSVKNRLTTLEKSIRKLFHAVDEIKSIRTVVDELKLKEQIRDNL